MCRDKQWIHADLFRFGPEAKSSRLREALLHQLSDQSMHTITYIVILCGLWGVKNSCVELIMSVFAMVFTKRRLRARKKARAIFARLRPELPEFAAARDHSPYFSTVFDIFSIDGTALPRIRCLFY